ncbi:MAG: DUF2946 family protein [Rhodanobacter sp.]
MTVWRANRLVAVAAHLALLLALCAPFVSRLMLPDSGAMNHPGMTMPMSGDMTISDHPFTNVAGMENHAADRSPLDACTYCSLFAHLPYLVAFAATLAMLPPLPTQRFLASRVWPAEQLSHLAFRPRGPPVIFVLA